MDGNSETPHFFISHDLVHHPIYSQPFKTLGGGFIFFKFPPLPGEMIQLR